MLRVLLVDDHPVVRHGIRQILLDRTEAVVGEADCADGALAELRAADWDVVVLDITMPGRSGFDLLKQLHDERPRLPVLVLSMHPAGQFARRAMSAGALGYLTKDSAPTELVEAIAQVRSGHPFLSATSKTAGPPAAHEALSDREYQVFRLIASGRTATEIAADIGLSVKTVSTYRARLLEKLGMRTNADLMRYAIQEGLID